MEDLIIFLIGIAYVGYRFYKKNIASKNNKPAASPSESYSEEDYQYEENYNNQEEEVEVKSYNKPGNLDEYIRNFFNEDEKVVEDEISEYDLSKGETQEGNKHEKLDNVPTEEGTSDIPDPEFESYSKKNKPSTGKIIKDFDLRKAVIYSEVLNRKYF